MTYIEALALLQDHKGRKLAKRRLYRNTTLVKLSEDVIAIRLYSTEILRFYKDGRFTVNFGGWFTYTTQARINRFIPASYMVWKDSAKYGSVYVLHRNGIPLVVLSERITIFPDGKIEGGGSVEEAARKARDARNERRRARYKVRYWILKARQGGKSRKLLTPEIIEDELNVTVRVAMIKVYGIERFLADIGAKAIDVQGEYELLRYPLNQLSGVTALKMVCPSTKTVYIHPVHPEVSNVAQALDWMFDTPNFRDRLLAES